MGDNRLLPDQDSKTIEDFGAQWSKYDQFDASICSKEQLQDHCGPLYDIRNFEGASVADIGSGSGCVVRMLLEANADHIVAVEPSIAIEVCKYNTLDAKDKITYVRKPGHKLPLDNYDIVVSFGVLHHITNPNLVVQRALDSLKPGGKFIVWLYGREGNMPYLLVFLPLRKLTSILPDNLLSWVCWPLAALLSIFVLLCEILPLPMQSYMLNVIKKQSFKHRIITIFDQLNPTYAKYYREFEAKMLLEDNGFVNVKLFHRHGYSWTVIGERPNT